MSKIVINGKTMPCSAAPPKPDLAEPACKNPADDRFMWDVQGVRFAFCSARCRARSLSHPDWLPTIAADILSKL